MMSKHLSKERKHFGCHPGSCLDCKSHTLFRPCPFDRLSLLWLYLVYLIYHIYHLRRGHQALLLVTSS